MPRSSNNSSVCSWLENQIKQYHPVSGMWCRRCQRLHQPKTSSTCLLVKRGFLAPLEMFKTCSSLVYFSKGLNILTGIEIEIGHVQIKINWNLNTYVVLFYSVQLCFQTIFGFTISCPRLYTSYHGLSWTSNPGCRACQRQHNASLHVALQQGLGGFGPGVSTKMYLQLPTWRFPGMLGPQNHTLS